MTALTITLPRSETLAAGITQFLAEIEAWMADCRARYADAMPTDGHDQLTYTTGWAPVLAHRIDHRALAFMTRERDRVREHFTRTGQWEHGYWTMQEAHHGTEHFTLFLETLRRLNPTDAATREQFLDAAEHLGNWAPQVPAWFDWDNGLFRAMHFGTVIVSEEAGEAVNMADHFRCIDMSMQAYAMSSECRYLELATAAARRWAEAMLAESALPLGLAPTGPIYALPVDAETRYRSFAGMAGTLGDDVDRAENFLASGAIGVLLRLWMLTKEQCYRLAAERLLEVLATQLGDPDAGVVADAVRTYRRCTGDTRFDALLCAAVPLTTCERLTLETVARRPTRPHGVGKRADMPNWHEDDQPRRTNPITLSVAAEITGDEEMATRAVDFARGYMMLARRAFPDGREHGCAAQTVNAITCGHGRENHAGVTTAVLAPIMEAFGQRRETTV
ncbi:MAG: hypothetical protein ACYDBB_11820 [Armatimonadota bacterium]